MNLLSKEALAACDSPGAAVVLVRVTSAEIGNRGTRSEMTVLDLTVERTICGEAPATFTAWRYTSGGDTVLRQGSRYVLACGKSAGPEEWSFGEFVLVPDGKEAEIVEAHLAAVKRLGRK